MIRLAALVRRTVYPGVIKCEAVRGPKKKKGETQAKVQSTDIINIFKDRADPEIKHIRHYPIFVQEQARQVFGVHDFYLAISHNKPTELPSRANLKGYLKAWKRQRTKAFGQFKHMDRNPDIVIKLSQNDIHHRRSSYDLAAEGRALLAEKQRLEEQAAAAEGDDE